jgi:hypothetical protein
MTPNETRVIWGLDIQPAETIHKIDGILPDETIFCDSERVRPGILPFQAASLAGLETNKGLLILCFPEVFVHSRRFWLI